MSRVSGRYAGPSSESNERRGMIRKSSRLVLLWVVSAVLAGCSSMSIESKKIDYKSAGKFLPRWKSPDLTSPSRRRALCRPDISPHGSATYSAYSSERTGTKDVLRRKCCRRWIRCGSRAGSQRWLV
ncbi:MAG: hypothetical protein M5R42_05425 [Rhodocyclaceae bacterium]|nr:hypothetical protein [Rhodocyclaceae bacterium]